jgi:threonine/homoserine/homoserine lactone efflux protein
MVRPEPMPDPRRAVTARPTNPRQVRAARTAGLVLAGVGLLWVIATWAGGALGWSARARVFFDLFALAGFGFGLYLTWQAWRIARADKG